MNRTLGLFLILIIHLATSPARAETAMPANAASIGFLDAGTFGFSQSATGTENTKALQAAVDRTGTIIVSQPGTYKIAGTIFLGGNTSLVFGDNVFLKKTDENGAFTHVFLNKGALTKTYDQHIRVTGLNLIVNGVDVRNFLVYGLHGQLAFFYAKDVRIERFRCLDIGKAQYAIHVCTFEDLIVDDVIVKGDKDGVHLGRGKRFTIRNAVFETFDDAIALNAHDYDVGNPELGWIEDGVVENCHDLFERPEFSGFFCRIVAGAWIDWKKGMEVQKSDTVVSNGRLYRVFAEPDGQKHVSNTRPTHAKGEQELDGIRWVAVQDGATYTAGVRNVTFRNIFLNKPRVSFSVHFDSGKYSRSYYPGAKVPVQEQLVFDNVRGLHNENKEFLKISTPIDVLTITHCSFRKGGISFASNKAMPDSLKTRINILGCVFNEEGPMTLLSNKATGKSILLKTSSNIAMHDNFSANIQPGSGNIDVNSDLPGLRK